MKKVAEVEKNLINLQEAMILNVNSPKQVPSQCEQMLITSLMWCNVDISQNQWTRCQPVGRDRLGDFEQDHLVDSTRHSD